MSNYSGVTQFMRCAYYGRYSTNMQRPASLEDQRRVITEYADEKGWTILEEHVYEDAALSGTTKIGRKRLKALEVAAQQRPRVFDYVLFDDTSRLSRDVEDVLQFEKLMRHFGIKVCFVSQKLDSDDPSFSMLLAVHAIVDQQYVTRLRHKVHSAQKGRVLAGFNAGSCAYGYRQVVIESPSSATAIGRAATTGSMLEIVEVEAVIIRRIFQHFADGYSSWNIAVKLNLETVTSPRNSQSGKHKGEWSGDTIKRMLHNKKYRGMNVWNMTTQIEHPVTGQIRKEYKPVHEHVRVDAPHLRIVSNELWDQVVARLNHLQEKQNARVLGGHNRAKNKDYLYSGLLFCGICDSRMRIGGKGQNAVYECPNHRSRRGCSNSLRIRQHRAAAQITQMLANELFLPEYLNYLVSAVYKELKEVWHRQSQEAAGEDISDLRRSLTACQEKIDNLIDHIEDTGSQGLKVRLAEREFEKQRIADKLSRLKGSKKMTLTEEDLQALVRENVANLLDVLKAEVPLARKVLQQHVKRLLLFPDETDTGPVFQVIGELDLFSGPKDPESGVLLGCSGTGTIGAWLSA
jgi:site-specific DNA recombinase